MVGYELSIERTIMESVVACFKIRVMPIYPPVYYNYDL
jgi:hypothetical protein